MNFEEKRQERIDYYLEKAKKHRQLAQDCWNSPAFETLKSMAGEPIKVGHHSEKRHRKLFERAQRDGDKAMEHTRKAEYYEGKAESAARNKTIYSDDENAIQNLENLLQELEQKQEDRKSINKKFRKAKGDISEMAILLTDREKELLKEESINYAEGVENPRPYQPWIFTNNNANIKRIKKRIEELKAKEKEETIEYELHHVRVVDNVEENRLQIFFPDKPSKEFCKKMSKNGFRFSRRNGNAWQRFRSALANRLAKELIEEYASL